jgi:hypothetical protein
VVTVTLYDTIEYHNRPSSKLWMRILQSGNWDRRKLKRMFRLVGEGR